MERRGGAGGKKAKFKHWTFTFIENLQHPLIQKVHFMLLWQKMRDLEKGK